MNLLKGVYLFSYLVIYLLFIESSTTSNTQDTLFNLVALRE